MSEASRIGSGRTVLVVIPTLNEAEHIAGVLDQVKSSCRSDALFVVADGGSDDGTRDVVNKIAATDPRVLLLDNPGRLQSAGVNLAVERFGDRAQIIVRCDAHGAYPAGFVDDLLATFDQVETDSVVVPMDSDGRGCLQRAVAWVSNTPLGTGGSAHRAGRRSGFVDHGHHAAFTTQAFRRVGGYDQSFSHNEDAEFDCRLRESGGRIFLNADIRQIYYPRSTLVGLWRQYLNYGRGRSRTFRKHPSSLRLRQLAVPLHLVLALASLTLAVLVHPAWAAWPAVYLTCLVATGLGLALVHRSACGMLAGPAAFVMHTAWGAGFLIGIAGTRQAPWVRPVA